MSIVYSGFHSIFKCAKSECFTISYTYLWPAIPHAFRVRLQQSPSLMRDTRLRLLPYFQSILALIIAPTPYILSLSKNCPNLNFYCPIANLTQLPSSQDGRSDLPTQSSSYLLNWGPNHGRSLKLVTHVEELEPILFTHYKLSPSSLTTLKTVVDACWHR